MTARLAVAAAVLVVVAVVMPAGAADYGETEPLRAVLSARRRATLSSEVSLPVRSIKKNMGEAFAAGEVLLEFDDTLPLATLESAKASLRAAQASLEAVRSMFTRKNASRVDLEMAMRESSTAETKLTLSEHELTACVIRAPFAGRIEEILVNEHELVSRGEKLIVIVDDATLRAQFLAPEADYLRLSIGDTVRLRIDAADADVTGTVSHIAAVFDPASQTFEVWADVDNADGLLRAGMNALVQNAQAE